MRIKPELYREAILQLPGKRRPKFQPAKSEYREWLTHSSLPGDLIDFLVENALKSHAPFFDSGGMMTPANIMKSNKREKVLIPNGLIQIGSGISGDPIVIDFSVGVGQAGYVSHEALWEPGPKDPRASFAPVALSIGEFLYGLTTEDDFPIDYYSAQEIVRLYETVE